MIVRDEVLCICDAECHVSRVWPLCSPRVASDDSGDAERTLNDVRGPDNGPGNKNELFSSSRDCKND